MARALAGAALVLLALAGTALQCAQAQMATNTPSVAEVPFDWPLKPSDIGSGEEFRLLFVTGTSRNARNNYIEAYNRFVRARAAAGHSAIRPYASKFQVVASTARWHARDNTNMHPFTEREHT